MGLFNKTKKKIEREELKKNTIITETTQTDKEEPSAQGWDAITSTFEAIYPGQINPKHYGTIIKYHLGGKDPLDGVSIYETDDYYHFVTFGLSELYDKETENIEYSGYGFELTLKLKKYDTIDENELRCICSILQQIAKITFTNGEIFNPNEYIYTRQTVGIDLKQISNITGFITIEDPQAKTINTPNGKVTFVELIGATDKELSALFNREITVTELYQKLKNDYTDYQRVSVV